MKIDHDLTPDAAEKEMAARIKQYRILGNLTQEELADRAMISVSTLKRFEAGEDISLLKFVRILKALDLESNLDLLIPDQSLRPSVHLPSYKPRKRATKKKADAERKWKWGDEK